ncbi:MAG: tyrosine--tRNA ligase [Christensenellaceae bacterium]|jgi:tyrosyl-tRNA synthetase|nr:tyrosine--tRNA ligase [Christensenellaceae bacterium]
MESIVDILRERGFIKQTVYEDELKEKLATQSGVPFYVGFDPTADSLHVGHFLALMAMGHLQRAGLKPIVLLGGGTAMVGDPSARSDMRPLMTKETINHNVACFKKQMSRFFSFEGENAAVLVNNGDWLLDLNYVDFIRDIGRFFSVNKMLTAECFKARMEKGLSFLEFNYMLMQAYDFLVLFQKYGCLLECGGDDQWSNILAGADLIRRKEQKSAFAMTFTLLTTSEGVKMGKTQKGALWLDKEKTPPYDFYQYFRNVQDADVETCLRLLTLIPTEEILELVRFKDERINRAKERLAFEVTKIIHGEEEAQTAQKQAQSAFSGGDEILEKTVTKAEADSVASVLVALKLAPSKGEAKRLIQSNAVIINETPVTDFAAKLSDADVINGFIIHKGKKNHIKVTVV